MLYLWLKALHVAAVLALLAGLAPMALAVAILSKQRGEADGQRQGKGHAGFIAVARNWDRWVASPALWLVWGLGIALAWTGGWFSAPWLMIKLVFVLVLSALHGMMSAMLRRATSRSARTVPGFTRHFPAVIVVSAIAIAVLVVVKPFAV